MIKIKTDKEIELANDYSTREETKRKKCDYTILDNVKPFDAVNKLGQLEDIEEKYSVKSPDDLDKRLKALQIIAKKDVDIVILKAVNDFTTYNEQRIPSEIKNYIRISAYTLTKEEFDLLKEVSK